MACMPLYIRRLYGVYPVVAAWLSRGCRMVAAWLPHGCRMVAPIGLGAPGLALGLHPGLADEPHLDGLGQAHIAEQVWPAAGPKRAEAAERSRAARPAANRAGGAEGHDEQGRHGELPASRDSIKGIRLVRMTWMMRVCVISDSTNQPVWKSAAA